MGGGASPRPDNRVLIPTHGRKPAPPPGKTIQDFAGEAMGTTWSVRLVPPPESDRAVFQSAIEDELARIISLFSHWDPRSELSRLNAAPPGFWAVSEPFWDLLTKAMDLADDTNGAVDPALGALVDLWGFGPPGPRPMNAFGTNPTVPFEDEIVAARARSGWGIVRFNREARAVQQLGGVKLDLSGIAKGHAVDRVSERLTTMGATHHLVEIGGELRGAGVKPDRMPWWVELQQSPGSPSPRTVAGLFDLAVATSGDWIRNFQADGRTWSHTIDGRTGRPVDNGVSSVTVLADTALYADAMATALTVMGPAEGPAYAEAMTIAAAFVVRTDTGLTEILTPAFVAMMSEGA
ncbi:MAG: FAD:protein FMN transferase [Brevundimonas sp.]|uniref:FAD:protein FMN transferase n=1 Tax=Brevundimonas sp. TaxID=1871086 RepID=UPI002733F5F8|nr:FAD:protein FMN transferase [Brevundimonas sp.]MDP3368429.1 FAD:protein FMN transferase [Brevundimonas sp.]MDP3655552.1 FAD:protein FMN transferase [Brevundimonas sp.]MDZ4108935.1 FAD:protein FMN transferase [Brevundimonas sp.]